MTSVLKGRRGARYINYGYTIGKSDLIWSVEKSLGERLAEGRKKREYSRQKEQLVQTDRGKRKMTH